MPGAPSRRAHETPTQDRSAGAYRFARVENGYQGAGFRDADNRRLIPSLTTL